MRIPSIAPSPVINALSGLWSVLPSEPEVLSALLTVILYGTGLLFVISMTLFNCLRSHAEPTPPSPSPPLPRRKRSGHTSALRRDHADLVSRVRYLERTVESQGRTITGILPLLTEITHNLCPHSLETRERRTLSQ